MRESKANELYEAQIAALKDEINYLRSALSVAMASARPSYPPPPPPAFPWGAPPTMGAITPLSPEEEDVQDMLSNGQIDLDEAESILAEIGYANSTVLNANQ